MCAYNKESQVDPALVFFAILQLQFLLVPERSTPLSPPSAQQGKRRRGGEGVGPARPESAFVCAPVPHFPEAQYLGEDVKLSPPKVPKTESKVGYPVSFFFLS